MESGNKNFERMLGISYEKFDKLDFDEQQRLISKYHKKYPVKNTKDTLVMIGGGDESVFMGCQKGKKIWTSNGYFIAGETLEENKKRWNQKMKKSDKKLEKDSKRATRLDFKTWLFLHITHVIKIDHPLVVETENKRIMYVQDCKKNEVYVFRNYDEYRNYFLMYLDNISDELIDLAIYTRGSKRQIVALKGLCEHIIVRKKMNEFYQSITDEQIAEIHAKGRMTSLEAVQMWESYGLCIGGSHGVSTKDRCQYFEYNCHECLMESASHQLEHEPIELKLTNFINDEQGPVKKLVPNNHTKV